MKIHKEGFGIIRNYFLISLVVCLFTAYLVGSLWLNVLLATLACVLGFFVVFFFRLPYRVAKTGEREIFAPADGKIVIIQEVEEPEYFKDKRLQVSIFMSPLNVHCNFYPVDGKIEYFKYHEGKYLVAWHPKSSTLNERTTVVVKTKDNQEVLLRQIAGTVARRIVPYSKVGQEVKQGEQLGFIKFGSRVDLFLPLTTKINVKIGDKTTATQTLIGEI